MKLRALNAILAASLMLVALVPLTASAVGEATCDPAIEVCATPETTPEPSPTVSASPTPSPTPSPSASPEVSASPIPQCGNALSPLLSGVECSKPGGVPTDLFTDGALFTRIANALVFVVGAVSVLMIIIGGLKYVISMGNAKAVTAAKDTVLYAIVGVVIAVTSFAVINFVITALGQSK